MAGGVKVRPCLLLQTSFKFKLKKKFTLTLNLVLLVKVFQQRGCRRCHAWLGLGAARRPLSEMLVSRHQLEG